MLLDAFLLHEILKVRSLWSFSLAIWDIELLGPVLLLDCECRFSGHKFFKRFCADAFKTIQMSHLGIDIHSTELPGHNHLSFLRTVVVIWRHWLFGFVVEHDLREDDFLFSAEWMTSRRLSTATLLYHLIPSLMTSFMHYLFKSREIVVVDARIIHIFVNLWLVPITIHRRLRCSGNFEPIGRRLEIRS